MNSRISGFYKLSIGDRLAKVKEECGLDDSDCTTIRDSGLPLEQADRMIENVIGRMELPLGIATNFKINGKDYLIPMATEEPSVVAAASNAAKASRSGGGFTAESVDPVMIGQIQVVGVEDPASASKAIIERKEALLAKANECDPILIKFGGGARDITVRVLDSIVGKLVVVHLLVDCRDAMGANAVNTMAEALAPEIETLTGGEARLRIISNLAIHRLARATATFPKDTLGGEENVDKIIQAYAFAAADPFRATTHNKGAMNGISAVVLATGNDTRAVEAGAHAYAAYKNGTYGPLTHFEKNKNGDIVGSIELPMAVGLVGGATKTHPTARVAVKILGVKTAGELAGVIASVGLAQNFAALRALATEGIQRGHMGLHARNIAILAGAKGELADKVAEQMVREKKVRADRAEEIIKELGG